MKMTMTKETMKIQSASENKLNRCNWEKGLSDRKGFARGNREWWPEGSQQDMPPLPAIRNIPD